MTGELDIDHLRDWIGREERSADVLSAVKVEAFNAIFDDRIEVTDGDIAPACIHWCLNQPAVPFSGLGDDGHPKRGGFLPPVPLPRRMWAGGELRFIDPLRVGDTVTRISKVSDVTLKEGRTGRLVFVTVEHTIASERGTAIEERQDLVYRDIGPGADRSDASGLPPRSAIVGHANAKPLSTDPVTLFRYSALTFNGHRIHYDRDYCRLEEGYPALVVHGPLQATLLMRTAETALRRRPERFSYRGVSALFEGENAAVETDGSAPLALQVRKADGTVTMKAEAYAASA